ncbi:MAG: TRAP transporter large permease [Deferribacteraceae bacterium]|jgi:C4-dicarboxylate transporter DctM subunit|nr:TRAP transporter large permease [Deferribacteraceae bacterium]
MEIVICSGLVLALIIFGVSVAPSFLTGSLLYLMMVDQGFGAVASTAFYSLERSSLLAIPLFMLAGGLMEAGGIAEQLINFASSLLKKLKGSLGATIPLASMFFGAISGSGTATVSALSTIMLPRLAKMGWDKRYTAALLAASAPLGYMIPPNMNAILFSIVADVSISALFLATVIPGIIWGLGYIIINRIMFSKWHDPEMEKQTMEEEAKERAEKAKAAGGENIKLPDLNESYLAGLKRTFISAIPALLMPVIIFWGIYGGYFSPSEAGAVSGVYALLIGIVVYRRITMKNGASVFARNGMNLGGFMFIIPMVHILSRYLVLEGVPQSIAAGIGNVTSNPIIIILLIDLVLVIAGFFLDAGVLILIVTPMLVPTANMIGLSLTQLAVIMFVCVGIGTVTPPMAMNLFITSKASGVPVADMIKPLVPMLVFVCIPILLLVTFVPELSLWLPETVMGVNLR